jgi:NAD(P)H-dependent FMN reductase
MRILAIPGSLGSQSSNRILLETLQKLAPGNTEIAIFDGISELPYFNPDFDREGTEDEQCLHGWSRVRYSIFLGYGERS